MLTYKEEVIKSKLEKELGSVEIQLKKLVKYKDNIGFELDKLIKIPDLRPYTKVYDNGEKVRVGWDTHDLFDTILGDYYDLLQTREGLGQLHEESYYLGQERENY